MWVALKFCFSHIGSEIWLQSCPVGLTWRRQHLLFSQECYWRYHACHTSKYESSHESTRRHRGESTAVDLMHSVSFSARYLQGGREFTFSAIFSCQLETLSSILLGILVRTPFVLCALRLNIILPLLKNEVGLKKDKSRTSSSQGFTGCASSSLKCVGGQRAGAQ